MEVATYVDRGAAQDRLRELQNSKDGKEWMLVAAQMPMRVPASGLMAKLGKGKVNLSIVLQNADQEESSHYNFATWFSLPNGGYWEYMNQNFVDFDPTDPPCVYHKEELPRKLSHVNAKNVLNLYGVVSRKPWTK